MSNSFLYNMPSGIPGSPVRVGDCTIEPVVLKEGETLAYGAPVKINAEGKAVLFKGGEEAEDLYGFIIRPYPAASVFESTLGQTIDVLRKGYIAVFLRSGSAVKGAPVYVRVASPTEAKPLGGIEANADGVNSIAVNATFNSAADESGVVEIVYNI